MTGQSTSTFSPSLFVGRCQWHQLSIYGIRFLDFAANYVERRGGLGRVEVAGAALSAGPAWDAILRDRSM